MARKKQQALKGVEPQRKRIQELEDTTDAYASEASALSEKRKSVGEMKDAMFRAFEKNGLENYTDDAGVIFSMKPGKRTVKITRPDGEEHDSADDDDEAHVQ